MRLYSAESMETLRARKLLKEWNAGGLLSDEQYRTLEQETVSELRTTNIFLRVVLFFFTAFVVAAATGLFFVLFMERSTGSAVGILFLLLAVVCYAAAEMAVAQVRLFHHGIEESLAVCSVVSLFAGLQASLNIHSYASNPSDSFVPVICAVLALWVWYRFGYWYMFLAAMIPTAIVPGYWTSSPAAMHGIIAAIYLAGLAGIAEGSRGHRFDYLRNSYSLAEALLWSGIYLAINLKLTGMSLSRMWEGTQTSSEFSATFYWITWVLTWCLPPVVLARGIRRKDRFVIAVGGIVAILTLVTNKPYLGWQRHTWDPILLGVFLTGGVLWIQRWLARGPGGVREGFTAARLSDKDKSWMNAGTGALGLIQPHSITPSAQPHGSDGPSHGGASGGGGASREF